jgi:ABC-type transport system involved in cytochrome bd biosynthesis fused ATPase/permease subunit
VSGIVATCCTVVWLLLLASVIDEVFLDRAGLDDVRPQLVAMVALLVVRAVCTWSVEALADRASGRLRATTRSVLVDHLYAVADREGLWPEGESR